MRGENVTDTHEPAWLTEQFDLHRPQLRALAYRLSGSFADAWDVVRETWVRLSRSNTRSIKNIDAWLITIARRICLDLLRLLVVTQTLSPPERVAHVLHDMFDVTFEDIVANQSMT
jgi:RNA polymerase sigma-70 factor (ECF subfamily)